MALVANYAEITRAMARRIGFSQDSTQWSTDEANAIADALLCGLRWFYFPGGEDPHVWSFLQKSHTIALAAGTDWYTLPEDFERITSEVSSSTGHTLAATSESGIRLRDNMHGISGEPSYYATRSAQIAGDTRYQIGFYPTPEAVGTVTIWYLHDPGTITETNTEPLGGASHSETILSACLAAIEGVMDPENVVGEGGFFYQKFMANLAASIAADRQQTGVL